MKPLTAEELAELRRLDGEGTPAPWRWDADESEVRGPPGHEPDEDDYHLYVKEKGACVVETDSGFYGPHGADRQLIPAARNALPRLLDELERSRALLKRIEWENGWTCPACGGIKPGYGTAGFEEHEAGCELAALIGGTT